MKKDIARSVAMPTIKVITMGMLMWGAHVLTTEPAAGASCYTCSLVGGQADCVEPGPGRPGSTQCFFTGLGYCQFSGDPCEGAPVGG